MKANDIKSGAIVRIEGEAYLVREVTMKTPSSRSGNTLYKITARHVLTQQKLEKTFKADEWLDAVEFEKRPVQLLFKDMENCVFMDLASFEQYPLSNESIAAELPYLSEGLEGLFVLVVDNTVSGLLLPTAVIQQISQCAPGIKGASASARTKPATTVTGLVVQVPEYLIPGDRIKINTSTGEFMARL